jgi:uncharacterized protein YfiM (DUF2279 family)
MTRFLCPLLAAGVTAIAVLACEGVHAKCLANDNWRGPDKVTHAQAGAIFGFVGTLHEGNPWHGIALASAAGLAKEVIDADGGGQCSLQDLLVTVAGGALGSALGRGVYVYLDPRAKEVRVTYSRRFQ